MSRCPDRQNCFGGNRVFWLQRQTKLRTTAVCSLARVGRLVAMSQLLSNQRMQGKGDRSRCRNRCRDVTICLGGGLASVREFFETIEAILRNNIIGLK